MKKIDTTLSQRDKGLLIILASIVIGFLLYYFVIDPAFEAGKLLSVQAKAARAELDRANNLVENLDSLVTEESEKKDEISSKYISFFYEMNQERILYHLDTLIQQSGLPVTSYAPSETILSSVVIQSSSNTYVSYPLLDNASVSNPDVLESDNQVSTDTGMTTSTDTENLVPTCDITLEFASASYASVMTFLQNLEAMNKTIVITSIDLNQSGTTVSGEIVLTLYSMPKVDAEESTYLEFLPTVGTGKVDPFQ